MKFQLEICCYNLASALIAQQAGAARIELCSSPGEGGVTPSLGLIKAARANLSIALYPIIRPRGGDFLFSEAEFEVMVNDINYCKQSGCDGVVIGMLGSDGHIDKKRSARLVELAYPMGVTFHRAFDGTINPAEALEDIIEIGCERMLTSGQQATAIEGASMIQQLILQANDRISIMPGSGIRADNIAWLAEKTNAAEFHTSARTLSKSSMHFQNENIPEHTEMVIADQSEIHQIIELLTHYTHPSTT